MKNIIVLIFVLNLSIFSQGIDYFPVNLDDVWEWYSIAGDSIYRTSITRIDILNDSTTDVYFDYSTSPRFNVARIGKVYQYIQNSLVLWYDFTIAPGDTFEVVIYSQPYKVTFSSFTLFIFGEYVPAIEYRWIRNSYTDVIQRLSSKHGLYRLYSFLGDNSEVIGCRIAGKGYGTLLSINEENFFSDFTLYQNYPNPFNSNTIIEYSISKSTNVSIILYNSLGQEIEVIENNYKNSGNYKVLFEAKDLASGIYYYKLVTPYYQETKKFLYLK